MKLFLLAIVIPLTFQGCGTTEPTRPAPITDPRKVWCRLSSPQTATFEETRTWSREQKERFVAYNERGEKWCGWKPPA